MESQVGEGKNRSGVTPISRASAIRIAEHEIDRVLSASVGGLLYPPLTTAFDARRRIDFTDGLRELLYHGIAGAITCQAFMLSRIRGWLFHLNLAGGLS